MSSNENELSPTNVVESSNNEITISDKKFEDNIIVKSEIECVSSYEEEEPGDNLNKNATANSIFLNPNEVSTINVEGSTHQESELPGGIVVKVEINEKILELAESSNGKTKINDKKLVDIVMVKSEIENVSSDGENDPEDSVNKENVTKLNSDELNTINEVDGTLPDQNINVKVEESSNGESGISNEISTDNMVKFENQNTSSDVSNSKSNDNLGNETTSREATEESTKKLPNPPFVLRCEICVEEFENENMLIDHLDMILDEGHSTFYYFCKKCDAKFKLAINFIDHVREDSTDKNYKCLFCNFKTIERPPIILHLQENYEQFMKHRCKECKRGFNVYADFLKHECNSEQYLFKCDPCGKSYNLKCSFNMHIKRIHTYDPVTCNICQEECSNQNRLYFHKLSHQNQVDPCKECGKRIIGKFNFQVHMRIHTGEKPYECSICGQRFTQKFSMTRHKATHSTEKPFQCNICGKTYKLRFGLKRHMKKCSLKSGKVFTKTINSEEDDSQ